MSLLPHGHHSGMFIRSTPRSVADCLVGWGREKIVGRSTTVERKAMSLERAWEQVGERQFTPNRAFLIPLANSWTAFFDNHSDEYLAQAELYILSKRLGAVTAFFSHDDRVGSSYRGGAQFCHDRSEGGAVHERQVMLSREDREEPWIFCQSGDPLAFENMDAYTRSDPRDRLNPEILRAYGWALGIPFWDVDSYGHEVVLLSWDIKSKTSEVESTNIVIGLADRPPLWVSTPESRSGTSNGAKHGPP